MKRAIRLVLAMLMAVASGAQGGDLEIPAEKPAIPPSLAAAKLAPLRDAFGRPAGFRPRPSPFARALDEAWKQDTSEASLKAWSEVLIKCQRATNPAWSTALVRSESQQAHCYRY